MAPTPGICSVDQLTDLKFIEILSAGIKSTCHLVYRRSSRTAGTTFGKYIKKKKACATMSGSNSNCKTQYSNTTHSKAMLIQYLHAEK